jgi:TIR domain-containing protein
VLGGSEPPSYGESITVTEPATKSDDRVKVFISYSRRDLPFTERLVEALQARGLAAKIDTRDLPKLEDWRRELLGFIREADAVVFVISSHSVHSNVCSWEIEQVTSLNKRLAPIVLERVPDDRIPAAAAKINYVYFDRPEEFEQQADALARALQTDLQWVKNHTRLGELAHRWDDRGRAGVLTLRGQELEEAERWIASRPRGAPEPTELHKSFLSESRRAATRRLRLSVAGALAVGAVAIGLAVFAFVQQRAAEASRANAVKVLATSDFQRGATALQSDETTAEGMALLARAVRRGQDQRAVTRLWILLQQRGFWYPITASVTDRASPPPAQAAAPDDVPQTIKDRFAKFTIKNEVRETQFISVSPDRKLVFTSIGNGSGDGDVLYRVWRADGTPITNWAAPEYKGIQYVHGTRGFFSPDGRFLALEVQPWRSTATFQVFDLRSKKRIGTDDILASGPMPQIQGVGYSRIEFIPETPTSSDDLGFLVLAVSDKGDATVFRLESSGLTQLARDGHSDPIVFAAIDDKHDWLMSASSDGTVRVSPIKEEVEAIGNVLQLGFAPTSIRRVGANGLAVALANGEHRGFLLSPAVRIAAPAKLEINEQRTACKRWDDIAGLPGAETLTTPRGELSRVGLRQLRISPPSGQPLTSPTFVADIVLVCLNDAGDRLAVSTADFVTESWAIDFSHRFGLPIVERRLFGTGRRPATTEMALPASDGKGMVVESFFFDPPNVEYHWYSYWDLESALPLSDRVLFGDDIGGAGFVQSARIDASGRYLVFVNENDNKKATPVSWLQVDPPPAVAAWIADLAEAIGGLALDEQGNLVPVADRLAKLERGSRALSELTVPATAAK